jgi:hypothetical protein
MNEKTCWLRRKKKGKMFNGIVKEKEKNNVAVNDIEEKRRRGKDKERLNSKKQDSKQVGLMFVIFSKVIY